MTYDAHTTHEAIEQTENGGTPSDTRRAQAESAKTSEKIDGRAARILRRIRLQKAIERGEVEPAPLAPPAQTRFNAIAIDRILAESAAKAPVICGVYFLMDETSVIYVGRSKDCHGRIAVHRLGKIPFKTFFVIEIRPEDCVDAERFYIRLFNPKCNSDHITRAERSRAALLPYSTGQLSHPLTVSTQLG